ncbi:ATP-binding cassette transporter [Peniophora sp. CONT]|nr:ATP-binding cassette transporter [Peniophora sp. CONT]
MATGQLIVFACLLGAAAVSAILLLLFRPKGGKIALVEEPEHDEDPFDVPPSGDVADMHAVDGRKYESNMKLLKLVLVVVLAGVVAMDAVSLAFLSQLRSGGDIVTSALQLTFSVYLLGLVCLSLFDSTGDLHALLAVTLSTLALCAFLAHLVSIILWEDTSTVTRAIHYTILALYFIASALVLPMPLGPRLAFEMDSTEHKLSGAVGASALGNLLVSYAGEVVKLGSTTSQMSAKDLPIVPLPIRAFFNAHAMRQVSRDATKAPKRVLLWVVPPGGALELTHRLVKLNMGGFLTLAALSTACGFVYYLPYYFVEGLIRHLELDPIREHIVRGVGWALGLYLATVSVYLTTNQMWVQGMMRLHIRIRLQLNSLLYAKTLIRKDVVSPSQSSEDSPSSETPGNEFAGKAQVMTLATTDIERVAGLVVNLYELIDAPLEIIIGTLFLYSLLGVSAFVGIGITCIFIPLNHFAGKVVMGAQTKLMSSRDRRISLMNEVLGAIRMVKFMALERNFEARVLSERETELKYQKLSYTIELMFNALWSASPTFATVIAFVHYAVIRGETLTPAVAFTSMGVLNEMKFGLAILPDTMIKIFQATVSLRRLAHYLHSVEVPLKNLRNDTSVGFANATATWPSASSGSSGTSTPSLGKFSLLDLNATFPAGELSLICGKLGSGKTLALLALLGEADILAGDVMCPRSSPDALDNLSEELASMGEWVVDGVCAYVPQTSWLRNATIKENILFGLPLDEQRYRKVLYACALLADLKILEDGDDTEIGEQGITLSGGQKARVSLARAVYSRASILLLDDVLSAVDAHTANHIFEGCLKGDIMQGRTVVLVSHHVQLCAPGAAFILALDNGRAAFTGTSDAFRASDSYATFAAVEATSKPDEDSAAPASEKNDAGVDAEGEDEEKVKAPRKLQEEEARQLGHVKSNVWTMYLSACGKYIYWTIFVVGFLAAALSRVAEMGWLTIWTRGSGGSHSTQYYITVYGIICLTGIVLTTARLFIVYNGSIRASHTLYARLLNIVLFATTRFHDTVSRGRLLNRFGKDFEGIDSSLANNFTFVVVSAISACTTFASIGVVGGAPFVICSLLLYSLYYRSGILYANTSRELRRLESVSRSPIYSLYGETISGVTVIRAFGASTKLYKDMLRIMDTNINPYYWMSAANMWIGCEFNMISSAIVGVAALAAVLTPSIDAALAGFILSMVNEQAYDALKLIRSFATLEQSMVALERVKEYLELPQESPAIVEPRPPADWPSSGRIECRDLVLRYAPDLPDVLHDLSFNIAPGEKVGILGRTGSGKSTLAVAFFRFVEAHSGSIHIDVYIHSWTYADSITEDPTILSGTIRSNLDPFGEHDDAALYEALRRVHLIPSGDATPEAATLNEENANVFKSLDTQVMEGGDNFSTGEKQLLCMARAILKRSKVLIMDEATASVDYTTDALIGETLRHAFAQSTILTIAHRLRTVVDYDKVMVLEQGKLVEFGPPAVLLRDTSSHFYGMCAAAGSAELAALQSMAKDSA